MNIQQQEIKCRLCGGRSLWVFSKLLLKKHSVGFYRCERCLSLQSEMPYWLEESYADISLIPDINTLQRVMKMRSLVFFLSKILHISDKGSILDLGGGNGLLVRLLRDMGLDAYRLDMYVKNLYALSFEHKEGRRYQMITAFQVWEHFSEPFTELDQIFNMQPEYVLITTGLYADQDQNWEYLNAYGRHIFCFSDKAREYVATKYGYYKAGKGDITLFCKTPPSKISLQLIRLLFSGRFSKLLDLLLALWPINKSLILKDRDQAFKSIYEEGRVGSANWL